MHIGQVKKLWENKETDSTRIFKTIHHNGSCLLLFGKR